MLHKVALIFVFLFAMPAMAHDSVPVVSEVSFDFASNRSYYACSYAERRFEQMVEAMHGKVEKMRCYGGLPDFTSISIKAEVQHMAFGDEPKSIGHHEWLDVSIKGRDACTFNKKMVMSLLSVFTTQGLQAQDNCWHSEGRYSFEFQVLK